MTGSQSLQKQHKQKQQHKQQQEQVDHSNEQERGEEEEKEDGSTSPRCGPAPPTDLVYLSPSCTEVTDADEDIFLLYTLSAPPTGRLGLGYVDHIHDRVVISMDLDGSRGGRVGDDDDGDDHQQVTVEAFDGQDSDDDDGGGPSRKAGKTKGMNSSSSSRSKSSASSSSVSATASRSFLKKTKTTTTTTTSTALTLTTTLYQSTTSLRSTRGDTGSVIWRSSLFFARLLLQGLHRPFHVEDNPSLLSHRAWLDRGKDTSTRSRLLDDQPQRPIKVLELGSGTGVLAALVLTYLCHSTSAVPSSPRKVEWIATDQKEMIPLLRRNLYRFEDTSLSSSSSSREIAAPTSTTSSSTAGAGAGVVAVVRELDWTEVHSISSAPKQGSSESDSLTKKKKQRAYLSSILHLDSSTDASEEEMAFPDLIISLDCLFNPSLIPAFLSTLHLFTRPNHTLVLVVVEMRSEDVLQQFLQKWLILGRTTGGGGWRIYRVGPDQMGRQMENGYACWVAWRE